MHLASKEVQVKLFGEVECHNRKIKKIPPVMEVAPYYFTVSVYTLLTLFELFSLLPLLPTRDTALDQKGYFANLAGLKCRLCFLTL